MCFRTTGVIKRSVQVAVNMLWLKWHIKTQQIKVLHSLFDTSLGQADQQILYVKSHLKCIKCKKPQIPTDVWPAAPLARRVFIFSVHILSIQNTPSLQRRAEEVLVSCWTVAGHWNCIDLSHQHSGIKSPSESVLNNWYLFSVLLLILVMCKYIFWKSFNCILLKSVGWLNRIHNILEVLYY